MNIETYKTKLMSNFYIELFQHIFRLPKDIEQIIMEFIDNDTIYYTFFVMRQFMFYRYTSYYINEVDLFRKLPTYFSYPSTDSVCKYISSSFSSNRFSLKKYSKSITKEHIYNKSSLSSRYLDDENNETSSNILLRHKRNKRKNKKPQNLDILLEKKRNKKLLSKKRQISRDWKTKQYCTYTNDISTLLYWHSKYLIREKEIDVYLKNKEELSEYDDWWLTTELDEGEINEWPHMLDCGYEEFY